MVRVFRIGLLFGAVLGIVMLVVSLSGPRDRTVATVVAAVASGFAIGMVLPAAVGFAAVLGIEVDETRTRQLIAGYPVAEMPSSSISEVVFSMSMFPVVVTFKDGTRFRVLGSPLGRISEIRSRMRQLAPNARVREV